MTDLAVEGLNNMPLGDERQLHFFDAFDAIAIATVLPVLVPMWKLTGPDIGFMISAGYVGQLIGALLFGWVGERYGRMPAMVCSIAISRSPMSLQLR